MELEIYYDVASREDFSAILQLQHKNLFDNLTPQQRESGFLSVSFSTQMLEEVNKDIPIVKPCMTKELIGYRMAQTIQLNRKIPLTSSYALQAHPFTTGFADFC